MYKLAKLISLDSIALLCEENRLNGQEIHFTQRHHGIVL